MPENKTRPTDENVTAYLDRVPDPAVREDCNTIARLMEDVSGHKPVMWGESIIGFGLYHYVYATGREGDMPVIAFSPRKQAITIYLKASLEGLSDELANMGKHKTGVGCLYIKSLKDIDKAVLKQILFKTCAG